MIRLRARRTPTPDPFPAEVDNTVPVTSATDGRTHLVALDHPPPTTGHRARCGHTVLAASLTQPSGPACVLCQPLVRGTT